MPNNFLRSQVLKCPSGVSVVLFEVPENSYDFRIVWMKHFLNKSKESTTVGLQWLSRHGFQDRWNYDFAEKINSLEILGLCTGFSCNFNCSAFIDKPNSTDLRSQEEVNIFFITWLGQNGIELVNEYKIAMDFYRDIPEEFFTGELSWQSKQDQYAFQRAEKKVWKQVVIAQIGLKDDPQ